MISRSLFVLLLGLGVAACGTFAQSFTLTDGSTHDGSVSLVNGRVSIGSECTVTGSISSVNGGIEIGDGSSVGQIDNVNGSIDVGERVTVSGDIDSVNGRVRVGSAARISGDLDTVNGRIILNGAQAASIETVNSPIELLAGTRITSALTVRKSTGVNFGSNSAQRIVIGEGVEVAGPLTFEQEVELYVHESASVGPIEGAQPISFSGESP